MVRKPARKNDNERMYECAFLHYQRGLSQVDVAKKVGITQSHVSKLLRRAVDEHIVSVNYTMDYPSFKEIANELKTKFKLRDVRLVWSLKEGAGSATSLARDIGLEAAKYFEKAAKRGSKVGISGGEAMYEFVNALSRPPRRLKLYPLVSWVAKDLRIKDIHASTLVSIWWSNFNDVEAYKLDIPYIKDSNSMMRVKEVSDKLFEQIQIQDIDFIITSVGRVDEGSTFAEWVEDVGLDIETLKKAEVVGDFIGHLIKKNGSEVTEEDFEDCLTTKDGGKVKKNTIYNFKDLVSVPLDIKDIQDIVNKNDPDKFVMLVAGDDRKLDSIRACLDGKLCNVLITDHKVAKELLN